MISSSQQVEDPRFAELLRPIKDLTANFNIPLSQFLDTYYSDLRDGFSGLSNTPMDSQSKVNFAQAGLLLQGTASVYSKKVEFLWQNVLEMLEFLSQRQSRQERSENGEAILYDGEDGENVSGRKKSVSKLSKKEDIFTTGDFLALPVELSHRTLIKDLDGLNHRSINFIAITPCQLIQKEGKETAPIHTRVNIYSKSVQSEILGPKDDFRVNSQYCSVTGVIGQGILVPTNLPDLSISLCPDDREEDPPAPPPHLPSSPEVMDDSHHLEAEHADEVEPECIASIAQVPEEEHVDECDRLRRSKRQLIKDSILEPKKGKFILSDIWEPLKPNDAPTKHSGKIRRSTLLNRTSQSALKKSHSHLSKKTLSEYFNSVKHAAHRPKREALINIPPELTEEAFEEEKRRKSMTKRINQLKNSCPDAHEEVEDSPGDENEEDLPQNWDECVTVDPHEPIPLPMNPPSPSLISEASVANSYEELVVKNVGTYVAQSQNYIESTDMSKRVAAWHEHIRPKLEAVEVRGAFNIHAYGTKVIDSFPNDNRKNTLSFRSVVEGIEREEISRYFLSCLMLANTSNLDLESDGMNHLNLTLLSKKRHHEELMASQEESVLSSSRGRKRVMSSSNATIVDEKQHQEVMQELDEIPDA